MDLPKMGATVMVAPLAKHVPVGPDAGPVWMTEPQSVVFSEFWCRQVLCGAVAIVPAPAPALPVEVK
jgi:hypothetical protein